MNVFNLVRNDFYEGTLKSKRYIILIFISIIQCMLVQMRFDQILFYLNNVNVTYKFSDIFLYAFSGNVPFLKSDSVLFPYAWFALFISPLFVSFDYMYHDLTHFGIQTLSRIRKRVSWWYAKCLWNILSITFCYFIIFFVVVVFCFVVGIPLSFSYNKEMFSYVLMDFSIYQVKNDVNVSDFQIVMLFLCPLLTMISVSLLQMFISLIIKPLYSLSAIIGLLVLTVTADWNFVFTRTGMIVPNNIFYTDGFNVTYGIIICILVILFSVFAGGLYFKYYDILPDKEEGK